MKTQTEMKQSNVESLARWAGPVHARGYRWLNGDWVEFAVTDNDCAWIDRGDGSVERVFFDAENWTFYLV